jgi:hypothetical protein
MVHAVRSLDIVTGLQEIFKKKIKSIFSLPKSCLSLGFMSQECERVLLFMGEDVNSFPDFKMKHDLFFIKCLSQLEMFLPFHLRSKLIWEGIDSISLRRKIEEFREMEQDIESFIRSRIFIKLNLASIDHFTTLSSSSLTTYFNP